MVKNNSYVCLDQMVIDRLLLYYSTTHCNFQLLIIDKKGIMKYFMIFGGWYVPVCSGTSSGPKGSDES